MKPAIILLVIIAFISCNSNPVYKKVVLNQLAIDTIIEIKTSKKYPTTLKISVNGISDDSIIISGVKLRGGNIDTFWHSDWYNKIIISEYKSYRAKSGKLILEYHLY